MNVNDFLLDRKKGEFLVEQAKGTKANKRKMETLLMDIDALSKRTKKGKTR